MEETEKIARRLEKMLKSGNIDEESALKYLKRLRGVEMTLDILTKTGVGIIINKIRKESGNSEVATLGKNIIKQWKKLVPDKVEPSTPNAGMKRSPDTSNGVASDDGGPSDTKHSRIEKTEPVEPAPVPVSRGYFPVHTMTTTDQFRLKAREMIQSALECGNVPSGAYESEFLAIRIESAIYDIFNNTDSKYKQRVRTRVMNLRDSNNPNLRLNVLMGHVNPDKLASMTSEIPPGRHHNSTRRIIRRQVKLSVRVDREAWCTRKDEEIVDAKNAENVRELSHLVRLTGPRKPLQSRTFGQQFELQFIWSPAAYNPASWPSTARWTVNMERHRAVGSDDLLPAPFKDGGGLLSQCLSSLFGSIWEEATVSDNWGESIVVPIFTKAKVEPSSPNAGMKRSPDTSNGVASDDGGPSDTKHSRIEKTEPVEPAPVPVSRGYFPVHTMTTTDQFRLKAREMIQSALECGNVPSGAYESEFLAIRIESAIYDIFNNTDSKYKQRVRTRVMNLRDSNNPNLRLNVLMGHVNPDKLASMTSEIPPGRHHNSTRRIIRRQVKLSVRVDREAWCTRKDEEIVDAKNAENVRELSHLVRLTGPRKPLVSEITRDKNGSLIYSKAERLDSSSSCNSSGLLLPTILHPGLQQQGGL
ncbi:hypothetical protein T265_04351 [Opisthorchis viverrini]|uniref:Transcription elongation factor S-II protein n=1 Tax=Opisthorchis viverrini TaxID=6198 RepID=A0A074ZP35_OPIVI|nr:hypothetical protein T265_04351 [Opisthorchis viverrini]KER28881.1 hypothetical protein T265_04351 [Opisthorchis viverrini]